MNRFQHAIAAAVVALGAVLSANAGSVTGTVKFEGDAPPMKPVDMSAVPECHAMHKEPILNEVLVLGPNKEVANIFVEVTKGVPAKEYPVPTEPVVLTQEGCRYSPRMVAVRVGQTLKVLNPDGILHNVNYLPKVNKPDNTAMPATMKEKDIKFDKAEAPFQFKCDIHPWMFAYCAVVTHPFFSITKQDGVYKIEGLDPGEYEITAYHERLGKQVATVTVAEGDVTQDFVFSRTKKP
ncbi:MAG TPA: carboxypeptidase regulatory-like domain-containing protein [Candidatus Hydrogenedentes bacterium]|nr:carboxypeptidase regulatory-like domain-containing protein [Candidatus Hydrogenedentota bacterium]